MTNTDAATAHGILVKSLHRQHTPEIKALYRNLVIHFWKRSR